MRKLPHGCPGWLDKILTKTDFFGGWLPLVRLQVAISESQARQQHQSIEITIKSLIELLSFLNIVQWLQVNLQHFWHVFIIYDCVSVSVGLANTNLMTSEILLHPLLSDGKVAFYHNKPRSHFEGSNREIPQL